MENETFSMLAWAYEHPYLYTLIKIKPPLMALVVFVAVQIFTTAINLRFGRKVRK